MAEGMADGASSSSFLNLCRSGSSRDGKSRSFLSLCRWIWRNGAGDFVFMCGFLQMLEAQRVGSTIMARNKRKNARATNFCVQGNNRKQTVIIMVMRTVKISVPNSLELVNAGMVGKGWDLWQLNGEHPYLHYLILDFI